MAISSLLGGKLSYVLELLTEQDGIDVVTRYLPLLRAMADSLNAAKRIYICAVTGEPRKWWPADVEMAAYQYWSQTQFK